MKKGFATLVKGSVKDDLYIIDQSPTKMCLATNVCFRGNLWHNRLGYLNHKNIQVMKDHELMKGFIIISPTIGSFEKCILGKINQ